jgi:hypothetical protein
MNWTEIVMGSWIVILVVELLQAWWTIRRLERLNAEFRAELVKIRSEVEVFIEARAQTRERAYGLEGDKGE